jgi:hypothetical protein
MNETQMTLIDAQAFLCVNPRNLRFFSGALMKTNDLTYAIIGAAMKVHRNLGPGLLESAYEACLEYELKKLGLHVEHGRSNETQITRISAEAFLCISPRNLRFVFS